MASSLAQPGLSLSLFNCTQRQQIRRLQAVYCQASLEEGRQYSSSSQCPTNVQRRELLSAVAASGLLVCINPAALALLEADDDEELLEKVKEDRKKKIKRRGEINTYKEEAASVQAAIYQLSKAGQALDGNDFSEAAKALGQSSSDAWIAKVEEALAKVSNSTEEEGEAKVFSSALASLQAAVSKQDIDLSKSAFVKSAGALQQWANLTGFAEQLKGL